MCPYIRRRRTSTAATRSSGSRLSQNDRSSYPSCRAGLLTARTKRPPARAAGRATLRFYWTESFDTAVSRFQLRQLHAQGGHRRSVPPVSSTPRPMRPMGTSRTQSSGQYPPVPSARTDASLRHLGRRVLHRPAGPGGHDGTRTHDLHGVNVALMLVEQAFRTGVRRPHIAADQVFRYVPDRDPDPDNQGWCRTQQDVSVYETLIDALTEPGALVLDPCCGSGTTLLAARNLGRCSIGVDVDAGMVELTRRRLGLPTG